MSMLRSGVVIAMLVLAGCATQPPDSAAPTYPDAGARARMVEAIRAAGVATDDRATGRRVHPVGHVTRYMG